MTVLQPSASIQSADGIRVGRRVKTVLSALAVWLLCGPLAAETAPTERLPPAIPPQSSSLDPALDAERFDALTVGRTFDTHDANSGLYGIESFYPDRQVVWQDAEGCLTGHWYPSGSQICFEYEGGTNNPVCWSYHDRNGWIMGWYRGNRQNVPIMLYATAGPPISCGNFLGS